jgi:hypothetical protein
VKRELAVVTTLVLLVVAAGAACDDRREAPCRVDTDCVQGTICRDERCGPVGADASVAFDATTPPSCLGEGSNCNVPDDCCTRVCTSGRCGSSTPPPAPACRGLYELCQNDCCPGLNCTSGACR